MGLQSFPDGPRPSSSMKCWVTGLRVSGSAATRKARPLLRKLGKEVLPTFISVADDPTMTSFGNTWLSGSYQFDDEGQKARRVQLIDEGVLMTFLMSRLPIASFSASNGHGRAQSGRVPTGRQGNLIVTSTKTESENQAAQAID